MQDKSHEAGYQQSTSKAKLGKNPENRIVEKINSSAEERCLHRWASVPMNQMSMCKMSTQLE